jgi:hypothetical protein
MAWLEANQSDTYVANAVDRVATILRMAGLHVEAFRLRGLSPQERAKVAWARLRRADIDPRRAVLRGSPSRRSYGMIHRPSARLSSSGYRLPS